VGGTAQLLEIVRREGGAGGPEALDFDHVNCCTWLNKYVERLFVNEVGHQSADMRDMGLV
jgi:hypothetical protein